MGSKSRRCGQEDSGEKWIDHRGLDSSVPSEQDSARGLGLFKGVLQHCDSLDHVGKAMCWLILKRQRLEDEERMTRSLWVSVMGPKNFNAMHRDLGKRPRSLFPLPLGDLSSLVAKVESQTLDDFVRGPSNDEKAEDAWVALAICAMNGVAGFCRAARLDRANSAQSRAIANLRASVKRMLKPCVLTRTPVEAESELSSRFMTYTGEEVPKMQVIGLEQVKAALPPESHGGSIKAVELLSEGSREFLLHPEKSLLQDPDIKVKLQAKVHVGKGEELGLFKLLAERRICTWVRTEDVLMVQNEKVLNGMFAVGKGSSLPGGGEIQRLIMNLIPTNAVFKQAQGATDDLPAISQYLSVVLYGEEQIRLFQSDMSSAFYLFAIPPAWSKMMCFNICFKGSELGLHEDPCGVYHPACAVIPMGWGSAVSIMQEIADRLTSIGKLPPSHQVRRTAPLPSWLVETLNTSRKQKKAWFHVYLDNFCAMEKIKQVNSDDSEGKALHARLEDAWERMGVLSSEKKRVSNAAVAQELGAMVDGEEGTLGPSQERLLKLIQSTLVVISKFRLKKKWVQVIAGRWVHVMSFRRPGMVMLDEVWKFISGKVTSVEIEARVRSELWGCCCGALLLHANLRAQISSTTTASDASSTGGAVGLSRRLTEAGCEFASAGLEGDAGITRIPVLVLSLFNGVGCCFRCYDLCGVSPRVLVSCETSAGANRVTSRRWPHAIILGDIRELTIEVIQDWRYRFPELEELHIWGGFPCVDLSSVKFGRRNLEGSESGLFYEMLRVIREVRKVFGWRFPVRFIAENVASMDASAEREISRELNAKPFRVDSADCVPIHRPRFCWHNLDVVEIEGIELEEKERWVEVSMKHSYPEVTQWLEDSAEWNGQYTNTIFPTCMKSIKRQKPPPRPAGLERASEACIMRWQADSFRFPPYQYNDKFVIWKNGKWRLLSTNERELLHGMGFDHTTICWSAGNIKRDPEGYEDCRKSQIGDSFNCFSFVYFAALAVSKWQTIRNYDQLWSRMGMAPGFITPLEVKIPLCKRLAYGSAMKDVGIQDLHLALLRRVNHTGSDVRISSGTIMNPRNYPRQSSAAGWWFWEKVFAFKWQRADHINSLELRAIIQALEWRVLHLRECQMRVFHLTDSYVCMSIISKGRTSSALMKPLMGRLSALLLTMGIYLIVSHVESSENPTDDASRE